MDLLTKFFLFFSVAFITALGNWGIPVAIYAKKYGLFKKRPKGFVGCNFWGVIMDVFIAGAINLVILNFLLTVSLKISQNDLIVSLVLGFLFMAVIHFFMAVTSWKEWIMPKPWHWNLAGYWHMVSMTLQMAYVFYPLVLLTKTPQLLEIFITRTTIVIVIILCLLFLAALLECKRTGKPW